MSTLYSPEKVRALAETGDQFWMGAWWILRQQEAAQTTGARASFMSDKISMDEAREKVRLDRDRQDPTDYESEWQPARNGAFEAYLETSAALAEYGDDGPTVPEILAACREGRADLAEERRKIDNRAAREIANIIDAPVANAADLGAPRVP